MLFLSTRSEAEGALSKYLAAATALYEYVVVVGVSIT
jgi:hypothetical protein